jgi:Na+-driven multidrug efflux pump
MNIQLSDHFTYKKLLRFTLPSIAMMIFTSIYGVVDGLFVSNFVGKTPFAAVNIVWPYVMLLGCTGFLFGTGGSALIAKKLGERKPREANALFSLFVYTSIILGVVIFVAGQLLLGPVAKLQGAEGTLLDDCIRYGRVVLCGIPAYILQLEFQNFLITAEKPQLGLYVTLGSGVLNMIGDALFTAILPWGLEGAALATALGQVVGGVLPLVYFFSKNNSLLQLTRCRFDGKALLRCCVNGSSELMSNISMNLVGMLYNLQLMKYIGEDGVAAYGVLMYVSFVFISVFIGYAIGTAPVFGFHYGALNGKELRSLLTKSTVIIGIASVTMVALSVVLARPLAIIFVGYDQALCDLTYRAFILNAFSLLFVGMAIFTSSFFTALSNGLISALIAFLRTLVFQVAAVMLLPLIWGVDGIWISVAVAEFAASALGIVFVFCKRKKYGY